MDGCLATVSFFSGKTRKKCRKMGGSRKTRQGAGVLGDDVAPEIAGAAQVGHEEDGEQQAEPEEEPGRLELLPPHVDHQTDGQVDGRQYAVVDEEAIGGAEGRQPHRNADHGAEALAFDQVGDHRVDLLAAEGLGRRLGRIHQGGVDAADDVAGAQEAGLAVGARRHLDDGHVLVAEQPDGAVVGFDPTGVDGRKQAQSQRAHRRQQVETMRDRAMRRLAGMGQPLSIGGHRSPGGRE